MIEFVNELIIKVLALPRLYWNAFAMTSLDAVV